MTQMKEASGKVGRPKIPCGLDGCIKEYPKSYMKTHQKSKIHNPTGPNDTTAEAVSEVVDDNNEALSGGTQEFINTVESMEDDEALEAEIEVFDELGDILEGDVYLVSMVAHMVTPTLFEKKEVVGVIEVMENATTKVVIEKEKEAENGDCTECVKYKEVEKYKEAVLDKSEKERKALGDKLKSMSGQRKYFLHKSKDMEKQLEEAKKKNEEMRTRILSLEKEKQTREGVEGIGFSSNVMPDVLVVEEVAASTENHVAGNTIEGYKCRRCGEDRESIRSLSDHMMVKHPNIPFKCKKCPNKFSFKSTLRNHMRVAHPATVHPCTVCQTVFLLESGLIAHRATKCIGPRHHGSSGSSSQVVRYLLPPR